MVSCQNDTQRRSGCQLEYDKPLDRRVGVKMAVLSATYFFNDP